MCTQYFGKLNGERFVKIVEKDFLKSFRDSINRQNELFLKDANSKYNKK